MENTLVRLPMVHLKRNQADLHMHQSERPLISLGLPCRKILELIHNLFE